jgi:hypothetical protein
MRIITRIRGGAAASIQRRFIRLDLRGAPGAILGADAKASADENQSDEKTF